MAFFLKPLADMAPSPIESILLSLYAVFISNKGSLCKLSAKLVQVKVEYIFQYHSTGHYLT